MKVFNLVRHHKICAYKQTVKLNQRRSMPGMLKQACPNAQRADRRVEMRKKRSRPLIDMPPHFEYPSHVRAGPARQSLPNPARVERQQR